jgi:formylglycine-generating enzyme required for sulfatase activity
MKKIIYAGTGILLLAALALGDTHSVSVNVMADSRNYTLTVSSARGAPSPGVGTNLYAWRTTVTGSVQNAVLEQGVNWRNSGWIGTGSVPVSGATHMTGTILLTNLSSSITWSWLQPAFAITNLTATQRPGTKLVDITYDLLSDVTNAVPVSLKIKNGASTVSSTSASGDLGMNVLPGTGRTIVWDAGANWNNGSALLTYSVMHSTVTNLACSVVASADSRDYKLTVASEHGTPVPNLGTNLYAWSASVTCSTATAVVDQGINWHCSGWNGSGSVPLSGSTNTTGEIVLTNQNSTITWNWEPSFAITNVVAAQRPGTKLVDIAFDIISDLTNAVPISFKVTNVTSNVVSTTSTGDIGANVLPGIGLQITWNMDADWNTNFASLTYSVMHTTATNFSSSITVPSDSRDYTLAVTSERGTPVPSVGTNLYAWRTTITGSVNAVASDGLTNWSCSGWTGNGDVPAFGNGNSTGAILLTNLNSSITWLWPIVAVSDLWSENVTATQRPGTKLVDVSYGVFSTKTNTVAVVLEVLNGTESVSAATVSGAVGSGVTTGTVKTIVWNAGADWNGNVDNLTFRIFGQDAQGAGVATPAGRVWIPAGQNSGTDPDSGAYSITVTNAFFMDANEVTKAQWDTVFNWALTNGYTFSNSGSGTATNHPVQTINWTDAAKWCNARSQMEGFTLCYNTNTWICDFTVNGYRLPTAEEWQYAARGGLSGKRFPWGDTITHSNDNYYSSASYAYDLSETRGFHPLYGIGTAPAGSGTTNGYGLYAMAGNVSEWCQDTSGVSRALSGGSWDQYAGEARCTYKSWASPATADYNIGFRTVQRASSSTAAEVTSAIPVDTRDYLLIVSSEHGTPIPNLGTNLYAWRAAVTCSVANAVISGLTKWTSAGWSGTGSIPPEGGTTNVGGITLTGLVSSIVWNWNTNYWLEVIKSGSGSVNPTNGWRPAGENLSLSIAPSNDWLFMGWSGDASGDYTEETIIIPMVRPVSINAIFSDDADDDGLLNTNETTLGTNPRSKDSDEDGMDDPHELIAGTSPTNRASVLDVQLLTGGSANEVSWYGVSGRYYQLEYTDNLSNDWTPKGAVVSGANAQIMKTDISTVAGRFYRIRVSNSPGGF